MGCNKKDEENEVPWIGATSDCTPALPAKVTWKINDCKCNRTSSTRIWFAARR